MTISAVNSEVTDFNRQLKKRIAPYANVKVLETGLERGCFTKHGLHLNSSGKKCIAQKLARAVGSFLKKEEVSPISLHWKDDTSFYGLNGNEHHTPRRNALAAPKSHPSKSPMKLPRKESQDPAASPNKKNGDEVMNDHPQLTKRQRNKPTPRNQDFFMDNIIPIQTVSQSTKVNELVNPTNRQDLYNEINSATNSKVYEIRLLHHNVQSLNN